MQLLKRYFESTCCQFNACSSLFSLILAKPAKDKSSYDCALFTSQIIFVLKYKVHRMFQTSMNSSSSIYCAIGVYLHLLNFPTKSPGQSSSSPAPLHVAKAPSSAPIKVPL